MTGRLTASQATAAEAKVFAKSRIRPARRHSRKQRAEDHQRIELGRDAQAQQDAGPHAAPRRPGRDAQRGQRHRDQVPVDERGQDQRRGQRHQQRLPAPSGPAAHAVATTPATAQTTSRTTVTSKNSRPRITASTSVDQPGGGLHRPADQDRVLDLVPGVGDLPGRQALGVVQRVDVGVAGVLELLDAVVPGSRAARHLLGERQHQAEHGGGEQHAGAAEDHRERRALPRRPVHLVVITGRGRALSGVFHCPI